MNPFETAREQALNVAQESGSDVAVVEALTDDVAAVTLVNDNRPFRATIPDSLTVGEGDTVVVGYTTSDSAYVEHVLTRVEELETPDTGGGTDLKFINDNNEEFLGTTVRAGEGLYAHDISDQPDKGEGAVLLSSSGIEANVEPGEVMYVAEEDDEVIHQWYCSTSYDFNTAIYEGGIYVDNVDDVDDVEAVEFNNDGSLMYVVSSYYYDDQLFQYECDTPFDVTTASLSKQINTEDVTGDDVEGVKFNNDGSKMFLVAESPSEMYEYDLSTPFEITTASFSVKFDTNDNGEATNPDGIEWNNDGSRFYVVDDNGYIDEYFCTTPFDITTRQLDGVFEEDERSYERMTGMSWNGDGSAFWTSVRFNSLIVKYTCDDNFRVETASFASRYEQPETDRFSDVRDVHWS